MTDGGRDADCGEEVHSIAVVASGDASEVLQAAEHALDGVAVAIEEWREAVLPLPICLWRDVWHRATPLDLLTQSGSRSSSASPAVQSATCPPVSMKANGRH